MVLDVQGVTDVCVNTPGCVHVETRGTWTTVHSDLLTLGWAHALAVAVAAFNAKRLDRLQPFLSATLPAGERIEIVLPPACPEDRVVIAIRIAQFTDLTLANHVQSGLFNQLGHRSATKHLTDRARTDTPLQIRRFFEDAVAKRLNIAVVGSTGSGKTTFLRTLCQMIPPEQRVVTIEDTGELPLPHANSVALLFGESLGVSALQCLQSSMRLRPDRLLLGEVRGPEAFDFLNLLMSGHAGSMTSFHANSSVQALERFALLAAAHPGARGYDRESLARLVAMTFDVIVVLARVDGGYRMIELERFCAKSYARATSESH